MNLENFQKLIAHAESGKLSVNKFNFKYFRGKDDCGTIGCLAGELPALFPDKWKFSLLGVSLINSPKYIITSSDCLSYFFEITSNEALILFFQTKDYSFDNDNLDYLTKFIPGFVKLPNTATLEQVLSNIKAFIEWKLNEK